MNRKYIFKSLVAISAALFLLLISCENDIQDDAVTEDLELYTESSINEAELINELSNGEGNLKSAGPSEVCGYYKFYPLIASKRYYAGALIVYNDNENLYVTYVSRYNLTDFHLFVGDKEDLPINKGNNPMIGKFPYTVSTYNGRYYNKFVIPLEEIPECYTLAAHAVYKKHTIWAKSCRNSISFADAFGGKRWGWIIDGCIEKCEEEKVITIKSYVTDTIKNKDFYALIYTGESTYTNNWCTGMGVITPKISSTVDLMYKAYSPNIVGSLTTSTVNDSVFIKIEVGTGMYITKTELFYGTQLELDELANYYGCPDLANFPYVNDEQGSSQLFKLSK